MKIQKYIYLGFALFCSSNLLAQKNLSEQIDVVRPYKPVLAEAFKISYNPEIKVEPNRNTNLEYKIQAKKLDSNYVLTKIPFEKMKSEGITKLYPAYVKIGGGNYGTTYGEAWVTNTRSKEMIFGTHIKHNASVGSIRNADMSENKIELFGKRIFAAQTLSGSLNYDRDVNHYYGYNHDLYSYNRSVVRQNYNYVDLQTSLKSNENPGSNSLKYDINLKAYTASDRFDASENALLISGLLTKNIQKLPIELYMSVDVTKFEDSLTTNSGIITISPSYTYVKNKLALKLGLNTYTETGVISKFHIYPSVQLDYTLLPEQLIGYVGFDGKIKRNSFRDFYTENPFLASQQLILNTNEHAHLFAGLRGNISSKSAYRIQLSYSDIERLPFFINDSSDERKFKIIYDGDHSGIFNLYIEGSHQLNEKLRLAAKVSINSYQMDTLAEAWHKPFYEIYFSASYNISNKFIVSADVIGLSGTKAILYTPTPLVKKLSGTTDINFGIDYRYSRIISVFLKLNNVLNIRHEEYMNYTGYGFNGLIGAGFSF